ncbi:hypothetical protein N7510_008731 [Penicillium lagena]|uniref:uncharacterized protein n=1 Tax=Penicillium lagena TaxID=94218 RepID=UPI002541C59E|nr:uncharacterized protein N7510_008731 [Penicillium lagena]KAJ5605950.1 hypothetical protein N7510_008731 [Penicillium lagena]
MAAAAGLSCDKPEFVFKSYDNLKACYDANNLDTGLSYNNSLVQLVSTCVSDYCANPNGDLAGCEYTTYNWEFEVSPYEELPFYYSNACDGISASVNSDIGGPGVFVSYLMQLLIVIYLWILMRSFRLAPRVCRLVAIIAGQRNQGTMRHKALDWEQKARDFLAEHGYVLKSVMVEYQEAQCWFMIACQACTLFAMKFKHVFDASTLMQLWADHALTGLIGVAGILPITIGQWSLQRMHMSSAWIIFLSTVAMILSQITLFWTYSKAALPNKLVGFEGDSWPTSCGGHPPPLIWCAYTPWVAQAIRPIDIFVYAIDPVCILIYMICFAEWTIKELRPMWPAFNNVFEKGPVLGRLSRLVHRMFAHQHYRHIPKVFITIFELYMFISVLIYAWYYYVVASVGTIEWSGWSFGQILALTMWAPVISKYIYWTMFGTESYSEVRVAAPYKIVKTGGNPDDDEDNDDNDSGPETENLPSHELRPHEYKGHYAEDRAHPEDDWRQQEEDAIAKRVNLLSVSQV